MLFRSTNRTLTEPCGLGFRELAELADEELMRHLATGHDDALTALFDRYHRLVLSIALRVVRDEDEAQDIAQEVFFNLYRTAGRFDPEKGTTKMWIIRAAYRHSLTRRKFLKIRGFYSNVTALDLPDESGGIGLVGAEAARLVRQIFQMLNGAQRRTLRLAVFEGLTMEEIAARTGEKASNVRHHYYRGLSKLRSVLQERSNAAEPATAQKAQEAVDARS